MTDVTRKLFMSQKLFLYVISSRTKVPILTIFVYTAQETFHIGQIRKHFIPSVTTVLINLVLCFCFLCILCSTLDVTIHTFILCSVLHCVLCVCTALQLFVYTGKCAVKH